MRRPRRRLGLVGGALFVCALAAGASYVFVTRERRSANDLAVRAAVRLLENHEHQRAQAALDEILRRDPSNADALFARAEVARHVGDYNGARNGYLRVLAVRPERVEARLQLFDLTLQAGARIEAEHHLAKLKTALGPASPEFLERQARLAEARAGYAAER